MQGPGDKYQYQGVCAGRRHVQCNSDEDSSEEPGSSKESDEDSADGGGAQPANNRNGMVCTKQEAGAG